MAKPVLEIDIKWGPPKLREIHAKIQNAINERTPLASETIDLDERPDGLQICVKAAPGGSSGDGDAAGGGGSPVNLYGAFNGAPAVFHLLQSSPPTAIP